MDSYITLEAKNIEEAGIRYIGRFDFSEKLGPKFAWSASTICAKFYGTEVLAKLKSFGRNYFVVIIDNNIIVESLKLKEDAEGVYTLAENLVEGEHEVTLVKRTEFNIGYVQFLGFNFGKGKLLAPSKAKALKLEIIGDSISCGFGSEGENENVEYDPKYDNAYLSYASVAARHLNAEHMIIACSGFGLIRNYGGDMENTMPTKYSLVTPESKEEWNFNNWTPQIVVINLGTNDFSDGYLPKKYDFVNTYLQFVNKIHYNYPKAKIICSIGPVIEGEALETTRDYIKEALVKKLRQENNDWIYFLEYEHQLKENGYGIATHPSLITHQIMGIELAEKVREIL